jgi:hypothetical protein
MDHHRGTIRIDTAGIEGAAAVYVRSNRVITIAAQGVRALDQLADLASDELQKILGSAIIPKRADEVILAAREHWWTEQN